MIVNTLWILIPLAAGLLLVALVVTAVVICIKRHRAGPTKKESGGFLSASPSPDTDVESVKSGLEYDTNASNTVSRHGGDPPSYLESIRSNNTVVHVQDESENAGMVNDDDDGNDGTYDVITDSVAPAPLAAVATSGSKTERRGSRDKKKKSQKESKSAKKSKGNDRRSHASKHDKKELIRDKKGRKQKGKKGKSKPDENIYVPHSENNRPVNDGPNPLTSVTEDSHNMFIY